MFSTLSHKYFVGVFRILLACILQASLGRKHARLRSSSGHAVSQIRSNRTAIRGEEPSNVAPPVVVFIAGIEGAGHHFVGEYFTACDVDSVDLPAAWGCDIWTEEDHGIATFARSLEGLVPSGVYLVGSPWDTFSYPCGSAPKSGIQGNHNRRMLRYPRIDWLQRAADLAGVDFRVLYLKRDFHDALAADCVDRAFENCDLDAKTLKSNLLTLKGQLKDVPKCKTRCLHYGVLAEMRAPLEELFPKCRSVRISEIYAPPKTINGHSVHAEEGRAMYPHWERYVKELESVGHPEPC